MALPPDAQLRVSLVSLADPTTPIAGAEAVVTPPGQVPLHFTLNVRSDVLDDDGSYGLVAEILTGGLTLFRNDQPVPVDVTVAEPVNILVFRTGPGEGERSGAESVGDSELFDTVWQARSIAGTEVSGTAVPSLTIGSDHRATGNSGCNRFSGEARIDGAGLSFGMLIGTQMACLPGVMELETAFLGALETTASYTIADGMLHLLDSAGEEVAVLVRQ